MEAYVSNAHGPVTDLLAVEAMRLIKAHLFRAIQAPDDLEARGGMLLASLYAGMAFSNAILGAVHAMAHSLGGFLDLPHGQCNAILMDHVAACNYAASPERYDQIGRLLGASIDPAAADADRKEAVLTALRAIKHEAGVSMGLADLGVTPETLPGLARKAASDPCMLTNPKTLSLEEIETVYENACRAQA
jgi:alcohol dehydrogenase class IV